MKKNSDHDGEVRYSNWVRAFIDMIKPQNLFLFGGRGVAKTSEIMADRTVGTYQHRLLRA